MAMRLDRRHFLASLGAGLALPALQACLPRPEPGATASGRLVVAQAADPAGLHPLLETGLVEASAYGSM